MDMTPQAWPDWYDGRHINEVLFCQQFLEKHPMKCARTKLVTVKVLKVCIIVISAINNQTS